MNIIKRHTSSSQPYEKSKLYNSIYTSCLAVRTPIGEAEVTAEKICQHVLEWLQTKLEVTSHDIRTKASEHLNVYNPDAAYLYLHHRITAV